MLSYSTIQQKWNISALVFVVCFPEYLQEAVVSGKNLLQYSWAVPRGTVRGGDTKDQRYYGFGFQELWSMSIWGCTQNALRPALPSSRDASWFVFIAPAPWDRCETVNQKTRKTTSGIAIARKELFCDLSHEMLAYILEGRSVGNTSMRAN